MKLFKIAFSNIKKRKSSAITLAVITTIAVLMLAISLMLLFGIDGFYETKAKELSLPHVTLLLNDYENDVMDDIYDYISEYEKDGIKVVEDNDREIVYLGNSIKYKSGDKTVKTQIIFYNEFGGKKGISIIDEFKIKPSDGIGIILPLSFKFEGFKSGEVFSMQSGSKLFDFTIYGFYEDVQYGSALSNIKRAYVTKNVFRTISSDSSFMKYDCMSIMFRNLSDSYNFETDFIKEFEGNEGFYLIATYESSKVGVTMFPAIMAMVLILVSIIIVVVALIIARFTIINNIEEDIKTLGALKSIGFTNRQIKWSMVLQFLIIALIGAVLGSVLTVALGEVIGNIISSTSGLLWSGTSALVPILISVVAVVGVVVLITYLMAGRSKKITPINALRAGIDNHSFKKNAAPFDKSKMPLNLNIAAKNFKNNLKNNITAFIMMIMFGFMTVLGFTLYHNFVTDTTAFKQMSGLEMNAVYLSSSESFATEENGKNFKDIQSLPNVKETLKVSMVKLTADGVATFIEAWDDIEKREADSLVDGSFPKEANEIAIPAALQSMTGKKLGEYIKLELEGKEFLYKITGITKTPGNPICDLTEEGFKNLKEDFVFTDMYIYLNDNSREAIDEFKNILIDKYGSVAYIENSSDILDSILGTIEGPVEIAVFFISGVEFFVICFVFFLMVSTIIRRKKKEAGIMKALGFTSKQLILQTFLSFLPVILGGVLVGAVAGVLLTNALLGLMFNGLVAKAAFTIPPLLVVIGEIALIAVCSLTVYLVTLKFKNIAPQKLIVEA